MSGNVTLQLRISGISWLSPLPVCDCIPTTPFDTTSLGRDYLHKVVSIQGQAHIAYVGSRSLISRSRYENLCRVEPTTLHQTCQWEHALSDD